MLPFIAVDWHWQYGVEVSTNFRYAKCMFGCILASG